MLVHMEEALCFRIMAAPARFELATHALEGRCSIQLSYRAIKTNDSIILGFHFNATVNHSF